MKNYNTLLIILLAVFTSSCDDSKEDKFSINEQGLKAQYFTKDQLLVELLNPKSEKIDSVVYAIDDNRIGMSQNTETFKFDLKNQKLGVHNLTVLTHFDNRTEKDSTSIEIVSAITPKPLKYTLVNTYPHDLKAYTEGLEFYDGFLYEGTGNGEGQSGTRGVSSLRKVDYKTGKVIQKVEYPDSVFGEGITILNGKVYQLTYKNNEAYVYDAKTLVKEKTLPYFKSMEGWGMTNDGTFLYYNDSSETIHKIDPQTFKQLDYINVYSGGTRIPAINELEYVNGKFYSNIYQKEAVIEIDPATGAVLGVLNLGDLKAKCTQHVDIDVINGIAYNPKTKTFFVTGKNWDKMFEIRID